jgi:YVTN family beta-propeller protein
MKNLKQSILLTATALSFVLASCHKDKKVVPVTTPVTDGLYVLNQGIFNDNNSTLSFYNYTSKQVTPDIFSSVNGRGLGDTGNDIEIYGSKMYIVVNVSSTIEVVDAKTAKSIKQIKLINGANAREPRDIVFYKNNAFITSYDGTVAVMDTAALTVSQYITVGANPEQLAISNGKLYVANSGGLNYPAVDNTVSVINLSTLTVTKTITVIADPVSVVADTFGNIYVLSLGVTNGNTTINPGMTIISSTTDAIESQPAVNLGFNVPIAVQGDFVYYATADNKIAVYNAQTQASAQANFITDGTVITTPYAIAADASTGEVFVTDAKDYSSNGTLYAFDKTGKKEYSITVGINPGKIALLKN